MAGLHMPAVWKINNAQTDDSWEVYNCGFESVCLHVHGNPGLQDVVCMLYAKCVGGRNRLLVASAVCLNVAYLSAWSSVCVITSFQL